MTTDTIVPLREPFRDERGEILNLLDLPCQSAAVITSVRGAVRGNHYHQTDAHYAWLQSGGLVYAHRPVGSTQPPQQWTIRSGAMFYTPPRYEHIMIFTEPSVMFVLARNSRTAERYEADTTRIPSLLTPSQVEACLRP